MGVSFLPRVYVNCVLAPFTGTQTLIFDSFVASCAMIMWIMSFESPNQGTISFCFVAVLSRYVISTQSTPVHSDSVCNRNIMNIPIFSDISMVGKEIVIKFLVLIFIVNLPNVQSNKMWFIIQKCTFDMISRFVWELSFELHVLVIKETKKPKILRCCNFGKKSNENYKAA